MESKNQNMEADFTLNDRVSDGQDGGPMSADEMASRS